MLRVRIGVEEEFRFVRIGKIGRVDVRAALWRDGRQRAKDILLQ